MVNLCAEFIFTIDIDTLIFAEPVHKDKLVESNEPIVLWSGHFIMDLNCIWAQVHLSVGTPFFYIMALAYSVVIMPFSSRS